MYHISEDKRAVKSAELIWEGLEKCLAEKELKKIRISDINEKSYVSRATFYRLFDSIGDVLIYRCDRIFADLTVKMEQFTSSNDCFLFLITRWLEEKVLIQTLVENNLTGILYDAQMRNSDLMKRIFLQDAVLTDCEADYLISILTNIIPAAMSAWHIHGQTEGPEDILQAAAKSMSLIAAALDGTEPTQNKKTRK